MDFSLSSLSWIEIALNLGLVAIAAVLVRRLLQPASPPESEIPPHPTDLPQRDFTLKELRRYDGHTPIEEYNGIKAIHLAVDGTVFDVTRGATFYGPGGPYEALAGHDASRALATMSTDAVKEEWDDVSDLTSGERSTMMEWKESFSSKYPIRGELKKE